MAAHAALIAETIAGMQRVINKQQYSSDSDEPYLRPSNRGQKLKRKAQYLSGGQLGRPNGPTTYRKTIQHAGYSRDIIRRNPRRYDQDGDELEDDEEDEEADAQAAEENPYADIRLETLLSPLTSAASLPDHPSLSHPFLSPILTDQTTIACKLVQRERKTLRNAKNVLTILRGDKAWIPCGALETAQDDTIFGTDRVFRAIISTSPANGHTGNGQSGQDTASGSVNGESSLLTDNSSKSDPGHSSANGVARNTREDAEPVPRKDIGNTNVEDLASSTTRELKKGDNAADGSRDIEMAETRDHRQSDSKSRPTDPDDEDEDKTLEDEIVDIVGPEISITGQDPDVEAMDHDMEAAPNPGEWDPESNTGTTDRPNESTNEQTNDDHPKPEEQHTAEDSPKDNREAVDDSQPPPRRMRTRAQAQAASEPTVSSRTSSPDTYVPPQIHPLFLIPSSAKPSPDFGLPAQEAEDTRRLLMMCVQKQEEVCRGAEKLYQGLLQADRQRQTVLRWCKSEGHVGEMSDGEDWYDMEEWGLEEPLRKGQADEEEEAGGKKTRGRRA